MIIIIALTLLHTVFTLSYVKSITMVQKRFHLNIALLKKYLPMNLHDVGFEDDILAFLCCGIGKVKRHRDNLRIR